MIYIFIIIFLVSIWILNKTSKNYFFYQEESVIREKIEFVILIWKDFGFESYDEMKLRIASNYFIKNPKEYNGTSVVNDFWLIKGLEPESVIHDYDYITAKSLKDLLKYNKEYCKRLRKRNAQWLYVWGFIYCGLNTVSLFKSIKYIKYD
jgi:uncharacterized protein (DUF433 family)